MKKVASVVFDDCIQCHSCESVCPVDSIFITDYGYAKVDYSTCIFCKSCIDNCPVNAILEKEINDDI